MNSFKIDKIQDTEFKYIYRLNIRDSESDILIIDIHEEDPTVKKFLKFNFKFGSNLDDLNPLDLTLMNGIVIDKNDSMYYISFGGLLCTVSKYLLPELDKEDNISIQYYLSN